MACWWWRWWWWRWWRCWGRRVVGARWWWMRRRGGERRRGRRRPGANAGASSSARCRLGSRVAPPGGQPRPQWLRRGVWWRALAPCFRRRRRGLPSAARRLLPPGRERRPAASGARARAQAATRGRRRHPLARRHWEREGGRRAWGGEGTGGGGGSGQRAPRAACGAAAASHAVPLRSAVAALRSASRAWRRPVGCRANIPLPWKVCVRRTKVSPSHVIRLHVFECEGNQFRCVSSCTAFLAYQHCTFVLTSASVTSAGTFVLIRGCLRGGCRRAAGIFSRAPRRRRRVRRWRQGEARRGEACATARAASAAPGARARVTALDGRPG